MAKFLAPGYLDTPTKLTQPVRSPCSKADSAAHCTASLWSSREQGSRPRLSSDWFACDREPDQWLDCRRGNCAGSAAGASHGIAADDSDGGGDGGCSGGEKEAPDFVRALDSGRWLWVSHVPPDSWLLERIRSIDALPFDSAGRPQVLPANNSSLAA